MANKFMISSSGATWDNTNDSIWSTSSGGANNTTHPTSGDTAILDGSSGGGTVTVNANLSLLGLTTSAFTGTLDFAANDNTVILASGGAHWTDAGTGTHTVNMGDGTWTFQGTTGTLVNLTGSNLTLNANGSTILFSAVPTGSRTFAGNGKTFNNFTVTNAAENQHSISISGSNTFANITLTKVHWLQPIAGTTQTISGTLTFNGESSVKPGLIISNTGVTATLSVAGANTLDSIAFMGITISGAGSITANNSYSLSGNSGAGLTINNPSGSGVVYVIGS